MDETQKVDDQTLTPSESTDEQAQETPETPKTENPEQTSESNSPETPVVEDEEKPTRQERRKSRHIEKLTKQLEESRKQGFQGKLNNSDPYKPIEYGENEYPIEDLQADREKYGESQFERGRSMARDEAQTVIWQDSVDRDNEWVDEKFPIMDENSDEYDPDVQNYINNLFLQSTGFDGSIVKNPIRYRDFVQSQVDLLERFKTKTSAESVQNVARQAGQTSIKSGSNSRRTTRDWSQPGAIASLNSDEYEKHKPEIEAWMKTNVNPNIRR